MSLLLELKTGKWGRHKHGRDMMGDCAESSYVWKLSTGLLAHLACACRRIVEVLQDRFNEPCRTSKNSNIYMRFGGADIIAPRKEDFLYTPKPLEDIPIQTT
jgi:hypothetical protein